MSASLSHNEGNATNSSKPPQPSAKPPMSTRGLANGGAKHEESLAHIAGEKFVEETAKDSADKMVDYVADDPKQKLQDAEDEAKGLFTKFCGCFGSA